MIDLTSAPSALLKTWSSLARWALGLVLAVWFVLAAGWGALHWLIVPRISEFRPLLEAKATQILGVPVRIGAMAAHSSGLIPSFELTDVQLFDAQGRQALHLPRVLAAVSPRSLWALNFEQLYVERPQLSMRRGLDGKIRVAGLDFSGRGGSAQGAVDWFFSQAEFVIHDGSIAWTDELRAAPTLALQQVGVVVRNRGLGHELRLDATPPAPWGERFVLLGQFQQPLLSRHRGRWQDWSGQLYASFARVDLSELRRHADVGMELRQGNGALRAWIDVSRGQLVGAVADVALAQVSVTLGPDLPALELDSVRARLGGRRLARGFEFSTQDLQFATRAGLRWPGGNVRLSYQGEQGATPARGEFIADQLDLTALTQIAEGLPLERPVRAQWLALAPKGRVERIQAQWQGPMAAWSQYQVSGRVSQLELAAQGESAPGAWPGVRGADIEFDFNQTVGKASFNLRNGAVILPALFDEPVIELTQLSTEAQWQIRGDHIALQLPRLRFSNADAQGEARIKWETSDPAKSGGRSRFPGVLDLQASLSRADATRVHRYLPTLIEPAARHYVRDAVQGGSASGVKFRVRGDLWDMPFTDPRLGEFRISAAVQNATLAYVPPQLQSAGELPWPVLTQLSGELVIERARLQVRGARARIGAAPGVPISKVEAVIPDLSQATVSVAAEARGALMEVLGIVNTSPLAELTGNALGRAVASGSADYKWRLTLPIADLDQTTLQGSVVLTGNDLQMTPDTPKLTRARGEVGFSESGFNIAAVQARMLGGEVRLDGGMGAIAGSRVGTRSDQAVAPILIRASGTASAEGLRQAQELGLVARLAQHASGSAAYSAVLGFRAEQPELSISSNLQGLALRLPAPFNKSAETALAFRLQTALRRESLPALASGAPRLHDQLALELGRLASVVYVRDLSGPAPRVTRGSIAIGLSAQESAPLPEAGVSANISLGRADIDAWRAVLSQAAGTPATRVVADASAEALLTYLPTTLALRAQELTMGGRRLNQVVLGSVREGLLWRSNVLANELDGYLEYQQASDAGAGRVYARLARLSLASAVASEVETLLSEQPASIPALDIGVDDFELRGKRLGRLEIEATNRAAGAFPREASAREWRLNKLNLVTPEAALTASGNWVGIKAQSAAPGPRRTVLNFKLDIADGGALLARLGMPGVVRKARGKMQGQVAWVGSPLSPDYPSMAGAFTINVESGQFLKADPGLAKLLGVLSLQSLPRRLALDFRDVFSEGFAFDFVRGDVAIESGVARTNNLQMKGVNAAVLMDGSADIARETQDLKVVVVPEINAGTASLIATVINPAVGLGTFLAQWILKRPLSEAATQQFHIDGTWADPKVTKVAHQLPAAGPASGVSSEGPQ